MSTNKHISTVAIGAPCTLSVIVPVYNEESVLRQFNHRLTLALNTLAITSEVIYIDDGSTDGSATLLAELQSLHDRIGVARFSRNFGKEEAMTAGLGLARGHAVIIIDADLQDPPELIPKMLAAWHQGADVVSMRRRHRHGESWIKKATAAAFYNVMSRLSDVPIPKDVGDFRLLSRRAVDALNRLPERNRFMKGLFAWIGFKQVTIDYDRDARAAGKTKWQYWHLWNFALEGITAFSTTPLKIASYLGLLSALGSFSYAFFFLLKIWFIGESVQGFPTLVLTILMLGGLHLMAIGILGEYVGRIFLESKNRPLYLLDYYQPAHLIRLADEGGEA